MGDVLVKGVLRRRYLVVVAADAAQARQMTTGIRGVATLAAISDSAVREEGPADRVVQVASQRLLVVWPSFAPLDADGRRRVVAHELTHAALAGHTSGRTPGWLVEGIALYVSGDRRVGDAARYVAGDAGGVSRRALTLTGLSSPGRDRPARRRGPVRRLLLQLGGGLLHRRALRPQALPAALRRLQRPRADRAGGRGAHRRGRPQDARDRAARARARPAALDRHAGRGRPVRALTSDRRCPSCPRSRRSAATWRPTWRGARSSAWRSSTRAGAGRSRRASWPTRSRAGPSSGSAGGAST